MQKVFSKAVEAGERLLVRSALNPILWLCGIVYVPTLSAYMIRPGLPVGFFYVATGVVATGALGFLILLIRDPDKLQSEEFQIKKRTMEMAQQTGDSAPRAIAPDNVVPNPAPLVIDHEVKDE